MSFSLAESTSPTENEPFELVWTKKKIPKVKRSKVPSRKLQQRPLGKCHPVRTSNQGEVEFSLMLPSGNLMYYSPQ